MGSLKRRLWKLTAGTLAGIVILLAIGVGLFNAAVPFVPVLSSTAEERVEEAIGWPLRIGSMDLRWQFIGPMLVLEDVALLSPNTGTPVIRVARIDLVFRPGDLLQESDYRPAHVRLHEPQLAIERDANGEIWLSGHRIDVDPEARLDWRTLLRRSLKHGRFSIIDGTLVYRDEILDIDNWSLRNFNLTLASDGREHEITGSFLPPGPLGEQAAFSVAAEGDAARPEDWTWTAEIGARQVRINWLYEQLEWAGTGRFDGTMNLSAEMRGTGLHEWRGQGNFSAAEFGFVPRGPGASAGGEDTVDAVSFDWIVESDSKYLAIDLENLEVRRGGDPWLDSNLRIAMRTQESEAAQLDLRASYLRLEDLSPILRWLPTQWVSDEIDKAITGLEPQGELRDVHLQLSQAEGLQSLALSGRNVGVEPWQDVPGISGIDLDISGSAAAGHATFRTEGATIDLRPLFRERIPVDDFNGELGWQSSDSGTALALARLVVANEDASVQGSGSIFMPDEGAVEVALQGNVKDARVAATPRYLPVQVMDDRLVEWLDRATPTGRIPEASWKLEGPLEQFPWKDGGGVFDIQFPINGLTLVYDEDWPRVENADVDVHFSQASLSVRARRGNTLGIDITGVEAGFTELGESPLTVDGSVTGDTKHAFDFLAKSPLQEQLSAVLELVTPSGPFIATVDLDLPLDDLDASRIEILSTLQDIDVDIEGLPWPVRSLSGDMRFTRASISGNNLSGEFTGNPLRAAMTSETANDGIGPIRIDVAGRTDAEELGEYLPPGWAEHLQGAFDWQGQLHANREDEPFRIEIQSTLAGVSSTLPAPLNELPEAAANITFPPGEGIRAAITLDDLLKAQLGFAREDDASPLRLLRGVIEAGSDVDLPELPMEEGLVITGKVPELPALEWVLLGNEEQDSTSGSGEKSGAGIRALDIAAGRFWLGQLEFADQRLAGERVQDNWTFSLQGPIQGAVRLPVEFDADHEADLKLEQLHIAGQEGADDDADVESPEVESAPPGREDRAPDPRKLPAATLDIQHLQIGDLDFGHVTGHLKRTNIGYVTENLQATDDSFNATVSGRWEYVNDSHYTSMNGKLESSDLETALDQLGYAGGLDADKAIIDFNLSWPASPAAWEIGILEGKVGFDFEDGQLREVSPGAGRLVGLLSLSALPRRLLLDFSDLFGEGLAFDELSGDYLITNGNAYTTNVKLEGASITAWLVGRAGLKDRDYDQVAIVDPGVGASIPVAGYLAAGPTVGAALLLASQVLKTPLSDITQVKYKITGSWDNPVIEEVETPPPEKQE